MSYSFLLISILIPSTVLSQIAAPRFDIQGHRGARGLKPENTIPAFLTGLDSGVTTLEMDVVISGDKLVVVSHEPYMSGVTCLDSTGNPVKEKDEKKFNLYKMTYDQIKKFDCGSRGNPKFPEQEKMTAHKPLLLDVILAVEAHIKNFSRYEVDYSIEIKSEKGAEGKFQPPVEQFSDLVYQLIDQYLPLDRVIIQSFDFRVLQYWHKKYPEVRLSALVENLKSIDENLTDLGFTPSVYSPEFRLLSKDEIRHCHALTMRCIPWTVNELSDIFELKNWDVDGIITDYPNLAGNYKRTLNLKVKK
jgi:glycerophosphoryl diester phosphodiesterase